MSQHPNNQRRAAPLAGRPPFATDEDDAVYDDVPAARPRQHLQAPNPNGGRADSMYQAWDNYLDTNNKDSRPNSGVGGIGMGLMAGGMDDSDEDEPPVYKPGSKTNAPAKSSNLKPSMPAASDMPKASFESSRSMGNNGTQPIRRPPPAATAPSAIRQGSYDRPQYPQQNGMNAGPQQHAPLVAPVPRQMQRSAAAALRVDVPPPARGQPMAAFMSPSPSPSLNPHPLNAPSTPITPVFARPSFQEEKKIEFAKDVILRGNSEETLLPRNTQKGEEFWKRFSHFAKEDPKAKSSWLKSTLGNGRSYTRWVWCISIFLLLAIGTGIGFGWYLTHNDPPSQPLAVGGSANESLLSTVTQAAATTNNNNNAGTSRTLIPVTADTKRALREYEYLERELEERAPAPMPTPPPLAARHHLHKRNRLNRLDLDALD